MNNNHRKARKTVRWRVQKCTKVYRMRFYTRDINMIIKCLINNVHKCTRKISLYDLGAL